MTTMLETDSMTSSVMMSSWLIFRTRLIWGKRRSRRRKLPRVMRSIAAMAWASVRYTGGVEGGGLLAASDDVAHVNGTRVA